MDDPMKRRYICTDTTTGILSAIYDAWKYDRSDQEAGIVFWGNMQQEMFCEYCEVKEAYLDIGYALLSGDPGKGTAILGMMMEARSLPDGYRIMGHLSHPAVRTVFELSRAVGREIHAWKEFLRFRELEGGILYARITRRTLYCPELQAILRIGFRWRITLFTMSPIPRFSFIRDRSSG